MLLMCLIEKNEEAWELRQVYIFISHHNQTKEKYSFLFFRFPPIILATKYISSILEV